MDDPILPVPEADPGTAIAEAERILRRPEYQPLPESLPDRIFGWIGDRIADIFGSITGGGPGSVVGLFLLAASGIFVIWLLARRGLGGPRTPMARPSLSSETVDRVPAAEWFEEARRCRAVGDLRGAIRCSYRGTVETLRDRGLVALDPGRTAREYVADVRSSAPEASAALAALVERFEVVWFGGMSATASEADDVAARAAEVVDASATAESANEVPA